MSLRAGGFLGLVQMSCQGVASAVPKICEAKELTVCSKDNKNVIAAKFPSSRDHRIMRGCSVPVAVLAHAYHPVPSQTLAASAEPSRFVTPARV